MATKDLQTFTLNSTKSCLIASFSRGKTFDVALGILSVLVFQMSVLESYLDICFKISYDKKCENCDNLGL